MNDSQNICDQTQSKILIFLFIENFKRNKRAITISSNYHLPQYYLVITSSSFPFFIFKVLGDIS